MAEATQMEQYDLVIVGAGAAGLGAAQYGARANLKTLVIEEMAHGGQALLIDKLENYPGIPEPVDGYTWAETMRAQAVDFGASIMSSSVASVRKDGERFVVETGDGPIGAKAVVIATGAKHRHLGVKGEEEFAGRGVSYCATCDGPFFRGKRMIVVGGGDSACDEAMFLSKLADKVVMVHRKDRFRAQKAVAARVLSNPKIEVRFETVLDEIKGTKAVEAAVLRNLSSGEVEELPTSAVFVFVGSIPQVDALPPEVAKDGSGSIVTNDRMETNVPGLFAAGDVRATPFRQVVTAVSDGAIAAHCAAQYIDELEGKAYL
ncbi:MAG TPA: thioredoxin-disulfide reductase [Spirochaetales bacterium]|nr:thioredoxin-disulfide reductase [Spirochaetales bacterium]HPM72984.1 thioredoxin-disulfide reductase [Spirochaetales bacterium]